MKRDNPDRRLELTDMPYLMLIGLTRFSFQIRRTGRLDTRGTLIDNTYLNDITNDISTLARMGQRNELAEFLCSVMGIIAWLRELSGSLPLVCHHVLKPEIALSCH